MRGWETGQMKKKESTSGRKKMKTCVDVITAAETAKGGASASPRAAKAKAIAAWGLAKGLL